MEWDEYKSLCDRPFTFSRWMLEQTIALVREEEHLADVLTTVLCGPVLTKPIDHKGGPETDMFDVRIDVTRAQAIHRLVLAAATSGRRLTTQQRGLGGFDAAWREYTNFLEGETPTNRAKQMTNTPSQSTEVVQQLIDAFNAADMDRIMDHFADDAIYHNIPVAPVAGRAAIRAVVQGFMGMASRVDWQVRNIAVTNTGVVLTERVDRFLINGKWVELPVMGTFEIGSGKITAWRDYFDMQQFQAQLAG